MTKPKPAELLLILTGACAVAYVAYQLAKPALIWLGISNLPF